MFRTVLTVLLLVSLAPPAQATYETPKGRTETFAAIEARLRQHPMIEAYVQRAEASNLAARSELGLPDPMIFIQEQDFPLGSGSSGDSEQKMVGFRQSIPAFGTRNAKAERGVVEARKARLLGDFAFAGMKAQFITVLAAQQRIGKQEKILQEQAALLNTERKSLKGRIAANQAGTSTLSMSEADSADVDLMRAELDEQRHETEEMLKNMTGEVPDVDLPDIKMAAWSDEPEKTWPVVLAGMDIKVAQKDVDLRSSEFNPSIEIESAYTRMNGGDNTGTIMVGLSIPLWSAQSQKPRLSGAKAALRAAEYDKESTKRDVVQKLLHLKAQIEASENKIALLKLKESLLSASSQAQTREYEAGKTDFVMPLKTRRDRLSVRYQLAAEQAKRTALIADFNHYIMEEEAR